MLINNNNNNKKNGFKPEISKLLFWWVATAGFEAQDLIQYNSRSI